jgi:hypothetical protein
MVEQAGTYREGTGEPIAMSDAKDVWIPLARVALLQVARTYHSVTNYGDLAKDIQSTSGIRTRQMVHYWIGDVLGAVSRDCQERGEPLLSSLCVHQDGTIGDGYAIALAEAYGEPAPADLEAAAAEERLACYRYFGAELPPDGGRPALTTQVASRRRRAAAQARSEARRPVCPSCYLELPATGQCDFCS